MRWVPFTAFIKIVPSLANGKRFEIIRSAQKLSIALFEEIHNNDGGKFQLSSPSGGQQNSQTNGAALSSFANGSAYKPQFGQSPAQLTLSGFYKSEAKNVYTQSDVMRFSGNEQYTGQGSHLNEVMPTNTVASEVLDILTILRNSCDDAFPAAVPYSVFRLEYNGLVFGDRGLTFPD
jgi:hypothetical protein